MKKSNLKPFLKWPGGKTRHKEKIYEIIKNLDLENLTYLEPFVGGGAVLFHFQPSNAIINDLNSELINVYQIIKEHPRELISKLDQHKAKFEDNNRDYYYKIRLMDRSNNYSSISQIDKAARIIFLNKTCFNGLYRVNQKGYFNTPIGSYENPTIYDESNIMSISNYLNSNTIRIFNEDYVNIVKAAKKGDVIYFDPPYDYDEKTIFLSYGEKIFNKSDLVKLRDIAYNLMKRGCFVVLSNNNTKLVNELFVSSLSAESLHFKIQTFDVKRLVNSKVSSRSIPVQEVLIYGSNIPTSG